MMLEVQTAVGVFQQKVSFDTVVQFSGILGIRLLEIPSSYGYTPHSNSSKICVIRMDRGFINLFNNECNELDINLAE